MNLRTLVWALWLVLLGGLALRLHDSFAHDTTALRRELSAYEEVRQKIAENYVGEANSRDLLFGALEGMSRSLDAHSEFWTPKRRKDERSVTTGLFGGLGVEISRDPKKGLIVLRPLPGSPAAKAGLMPGDRIVEIDGTETLEIDVDRAKDLIRGQPGTIVRLGVHRQGHEESLFFDVERAEIKIDSVQDVLILESPSGAGARIPTGTPKIGYVFIVKFQEATAADLDKALQKLQAEGMQGFILDLRGNHGGLLDEALAVCELFVKDGLILTVRGRNGQSGTHKDEEFLSNGVSHKGEFPMALLVDGGSASASEIVAGCLKDRGRAVLVGEKTYGKGSVQTILPIPLQDWGEAALKLTTGRFHSPSGAVIDGKGVTPQHIVPLDQAQHIALQRERYRRQVLRDAQNGGGIPPGFDRQGDGDPSEPFHDVQLEKAVELLTKEITKRGG